MGVLAAVRKELQPKTFALAVPASMEAVAVQLQCNLGNLTVVSAYVHPHSTILQAELEAFLESIPHPCVIGGDWNAKHPLWGDHRQDARGDLLQSALDYSNLVVLNTGGYTRYDVHRSPSAIDITLASADISLYFDLQILDHPHGSDHIPISFGTATIIPEINLQQAVNYRRIDWDSFVGRVEDSIAAYPGVLDYGSFFQIIWENLTMSSPSPRNRSNRNVPLPYWCEELKVALENSREKFKAWRRSLAYSAYEEYKQAEDNFKKLVKSKRKESWKAHCDTLNSQTSVNDLWRWAKRYKGRIAGPQQQLRCEHKLEEVLDRLAPPYTETAPLEESQCDCNYHAQRGAGYFSIHDLQPAFKQGKDSAPGMDGICYSVLNHLPFNGQVTLLGIYNAIFESGTIPEAWKTFKIIPILKPGKPSDDSKSYRPIALASCFRKTYENMIKEKIEWFLEHNRLLPESICGFRKGRGTMDALHILINEIQSAFHNNQHVILCSVDVQSAYDNVHISLLIKELREIGISECLVKAVHGLFSERKISASIDNKNYIERTTWIGLPQGSPLSPLCFNILISKLMETQTGGPIKVGFADDMSIVVRGADLRGSVRTMQAAVNEMVDGLHSVRLEVAPSKCSAMVFSKRALECHYPLYINDSIVDYEDSIKLLGLHLTTTLSWGKQINYIKQRTSLYTNFMRSVAGQDWGAHPSALLAIYKTCVRSVLDYGSIFFGNATGKELITLDRIQWNCIRIILGSTKTTHTGSLEVMSGLLPLQLRRERLASKFVNRRFSLEPWNEWFVKPVVEGRAGQSIIGRLILSYRGFTGPIATIQILPCFQFNPEERHRILSVDLSVQKLMEDRPTVHIAEQVDTLIRTKYPDTILLATDGSKCAAGCGYAVVNHEGEPLSRTKLPVMVCIYHAELLAILKALFHIEQHQGRRFVIVSDSLSSLKSLSNRRLQPNVPLIWY